MRLGGLVGFGVGLLVVVEVGGGGEGAEEGEQEHEAEGLEEPGGVDQLDGLVFGWGWAVAAVVVEAGLGADGFGRAWHGSSSTRPASHAGE